MAGSSWRDDRLRCAAVFHEIIRQSNWRPATRNEWSNMSNTESEDQPSIHYNIQVPGHGLVEEVEPLAQEVTALAREIESVNVINPFAAFIRLRRLETSRSELAKKVGEKLSKSLGALRSPVNNAPGGMAGYFQALSVGQSLTATLILQGQWQRLVSSFDRKSAFTVASISIYISIVALLVTIGFGIATLS
jgi:hypothetical protein